MRAAQLSIDFQALRHNLAYLKTRAGNARVMPVIKANAYGHGAKHVARCLDVADAFAVAFVAEAAELRESGVHKPILVLQGAHARNEYKLAEQLGLWLVVHSEAQVRDAVASGVTVPIWLKVDTGMSRLGVDVKSVPAILSMLGSRCMALMSHFSRADVVGAQENLQQLRRFKDVADRHNLPCSMSNSAGLLSAPDSHFDWVRPGIALYGGNPFVSLSEKPADLRPAMTLTAPFASVSWHARGSRVGYAGITELEEDMPIGVVSAGYADGYPRSAVPGTPVLVNGVQCPIVGRISMDMVCVDLRNIPNAKCGDRVELWGNGVPVDLVADAAGTISYELMCRAGAALLTRGGRD